MKSSFFFIFLKWNSIRMSLLEANLLNTFSLKFGNEATNFFILKASVVLTNNLQTLNF